MLHTRITTLAGLVGEGRGGGCGGDICCCFFFLKKKPFLVLQWIAFIFGRGEEEDQSVGMSCARETILTFFILYLSPLKLKSCAGHNSHTV